MVERSPPDLFPIKNAKPTIEEEGQDKLVVYEVESIPVGDEFSYPHDNEVKNAYFRVIRANGRLVDIKNPIQFTGRRRRRSIFSK
jgi:hypothetical protein